jgi:hypothetical protein
MRNLFRPGLTLVLLAAGSMALASDSLPQSPIAPELSRMNVWVGRWESKTEIMDTPFSQAASMSSEMTCSWSPNHGFVLCDHLLHATDGSTTNSLSVYTYDDQAKSYKFFGVEKDASPREAPMEVNGNVWSFGTEVQNNDKMIMFLTSDEFVSPTQMRFQTQFSEDNGAHWQKMNEGNLTKIG